MTDEVQAEGDRLITVHMRDAVGTEVLRLVSHPVAASDIRRWAIAVHWPDPPPERWAATAVDSDLVAPEEFNPFAWTVRTCTPDWAPTIRLDDPQRIEKLLNVQGPAVSFNLHGGIAAEYHEPIRAGDTITSTTTLEGYQERDGTLGRMLLTTHLETWTNQRDELVKTCLLTFIRY